jgi:ribosomal protein S18 acetylase RimI-like enzyme
MRCEFTIRRATPADLEQASTVCFEAFKGINAAHGFPPDFEQREHAMGMMQLALNTPSVYGVAAESGGRVVGSAFLWEDGVIAGIGPVTVDPGAQAQSVGRAMMQSLLDRADERRFAGVRLVQAAFNTRSLALYTKLGFDVREPLLTLNGQVARKVVPGLAVRAMNEADLDACNALCRDVHGHDRRAEVMFGLAHGTARVVERSGVMTGYCSDVGFFGHMVARDNASLCALIAAAPQISGPGFLLPSRNAEVLRWCLEQGLRVIHPMTLMSRGLYTTPRAAFVPSILF